LELAEHKSAKFPQLEDVRLTEELEGYMSPLEEWKIPDDLLVALEAAGIYLLTELILRLNPEWW
jgi:hypothetical protein